jgi:hypothetical protein
MVRVSVCTTTHANIDEDDSQWWNLIILAVVQMDESFDERETRNKRRRERWAKLSVVEREERTRSVPRYSLPDPCESPWAKVYRSRSERAIITLTGLNHAAFGRLLAAFAPEFFSHTPWQEDKSFGIRKLNESERRGRPRKISSHACLAMTLLWTRTTCQHWMMSTTFGLVGTSCGDWL